MDTTKNPKEVIRSTFFLIELNNGNEIPCVSIQDVRSIFNLSEKELQQILSAARNYCKEWSMKTLYNNHFIQIPADNIDAISVVGMSFICKELNHVNPKLKEFSEDFKDFALEWFFKVDFYKKHSTTIRNARVGLETNIDWETAMEYSVTKGIVSELKKPKEDCEDTGHIFYRKKIVITGEFHKFQIRNEMAELLYNCGADINSSISRKTDYVIVGSNAGPKKLEKIAELGITIISENEFYQIFEI